MKLKFLLLICLFSTSLITAQTEFGIKAGLNVSNVDTNISGSSFEGRLGGYVGTFVDFALSEKFHLQPEILYSTEGIEDGGLDFLNIPVILKWYFVEGIHINAGPQLGVLIDAEGGTNGLNTTQLSGVVGLGYETAGGFMIDSRFSMGATSIIDENFAVDSGMGYNIVGIKGWTRTLSFGIGYKF